MSLTLPPPTVLAKAQHALGEGPLWFDQRWWWTDIEGGTIFSRKADGSDPWFHDFGRKVPAFARWDARHLLIVFDRSLALWNRSSDTLEELARLDDHLEPTTNRFNDGKWGPDGRFLVGTLSTTGQKDAASLYVFDRERGLKQLLSGVGLSNGLAWTQDGRVIYHVDSLKGTITASDYAEGTLSHPRIVIQSSPHLGLPDGMDIDPEGHLWVAHWGGSAVRCWSPRTGKCLREIPLPCPQPSSCCFGGPESRQLLITTARVSLSEEVLSEHPLSGSVFLWDGSIA